MLIGYANNKLKKICTETKEARKLLPQRSVPLLVQRLGELSAIGKLGDIPFNSTPFHLHPLRGTRKGLFAVRIGPRHRIVFATAGSLAMNEDGIADPLSATEIEIVEVGDYHDE